METKQTTDNGQIVTIDDSIDNLGCGCDNIEFGVKYKCGNKINGFLYLCVDCDKKANRRRSQGC